MMTNDGIIKCQATDPILRTSNEWPFQTDVAKDPMYGITQVQTILLLLKNEKKRE